jgi:hypothetical protein
LIRHSLMCKLLCHIQATHVVIYSAQMVFQDVFQFVLIVATYMGSTCIFILTGSSHPQFCFFFFFFPSRLARCHAKKSQPPYNLFFFLRVSLFYFNCTFFISINYFKLEKKFQIHPPLICFVF